MGDRLLAPDGTCLACARRCNLLLGVGLCGVRRLDPDEVVVVDGEIGLNRPSAWHRVRRTKALHVG